MKSQRNDRFPAAFSNALSPTGGYPMQVTTCTMQPHTGTNGAERAILQDSPLTLPGEILQTAVRPGSERQQHFLALAAAHAEDFQTRVAQHDRENSFPFENVAAMRASGYTTMTAPAELGGGGASVLDVVLAQERLARGDGPT